MGWYGPQSGGCSCCESIGDLLVTGDFGPSPGATPPYTENDRPGSGLSLWSGARSRWLDLVSPNVGISDQRRSIAITRGRPAIGIWNSNYPVIEFDGSAWQQISGYVSNSPYTTFVTANDVFEFEGDLFVAGNFNVIDGVTVNKIGRWDGSQWNSTGSTFNKTPGLSDEQASKFVVYNDQLHATGYFSGTPDTYANARTLAVWDGSGWTRLGAGSGNWLYGYDYAVFDDKICSGYRTWDGSSIADIGYPQLSGSYGEFFCVAVYDGCLYVGGAFDQIYDYSSTLNISTVAKWDGSAWSAAFTSGLSDPAGFDPLSCTAMTVYNGELILTGNFLKAGGVAHDRIVRWNGSAFLSMHPGGALGKDFAVWQP